MSRHVSAVRAHGTLQAPRPLTPADFPGVPDGELVVVIDHRAFQRGLETFRLSSRAVHAVDVPNPRVLTAAEWAAIGEGSKGVRDDGTRSVLDLDPGTGATVSVPVVVVGAHA